MTLLLLSLVFTIGVILFPRVVRWWAVSDAVDQVIVEAERITAGAA